MVFRQVNDSLQRACGSWRPWLATCMACVHSVINAEIYAPGNLRCLIAYTRGQSWDNFPESPVREQDERKRRT